MNEKKYSISVVTMTRNSATKIRDCLESAKWSDDIVVIDDFSKDNTLDIVGEYTNNIHQRKWENEGRQRNFAYSKAKNEYILSLDSDERITSELQDELIRLAEEGFTHNGYNVPHKNYIGNRWIRHGGWYPNRKLKLFKKSEFRYAEEEYHPPAIMEGERKDLNGEIIHLAYKDFSDMVRKVDHQTNFESEKWFRDKRKMSLARALRKSFDRFFKAYFLKQGFRDGFLGFMMAFFGGFYQLLSYAKYAELKKETER
ncbi:MAG: glycosyltransferase family 2 protein [Candidatus Omnitrophica bacterium]|nr:glycosyltransferase family 2 protein [Candidatus Omnitrophota bacterium]